jgi:2-dehydro-3-deoxyphosphogluconate aldolase / (4S)-4-hydroxy-2-oxoglutarate aldolase
MPAMPDPRAVDALRASPVADLIRSARLIAILRQIEPQTRLLDLVDALVGDGVRILEVTFDAPNAAEDLVALRQRLDEGGRGDVAVGAGTIRTTDALQAAVDAGAAFAVSPTLDLALVEGSIALGLPIIPGAYSPTEIDLAWQGGATFVKIFPASSLGPAHVREMRGPFPDIEVIATGGVDAGSAAAFLRAGCVAVGVGSALTNADPAARRALIAAVAT